jgi:hypothetical protein
MKMNTAEKQRESVVKVLGDLAYEGVFVYETSHELWTRIVVQDDRLTREEVAKMFSPKFTIENDDADIRSLYISNTKIGYSYLASITK